MNKNTKLLFAHKVLYDVYFYGVLSIPFFVTKGYDISTALAFASMYMLVTMALEVPTGFVGDRFGHKASVVAGPILTGLGFIGLLSVDSLLTDSSFMIMLAAGASLTSGSDTALLRSISTNFKRDNRTFDYLKSIMLLFSFGAAGFIVKYLSIDIAVGLSAALAIASAVPLLLVKTKPETKNKKVSSFKSQLTELPGALKSVIGGPSLILMAGMVASITYSAKEIISSLNPVYQVDIELIGLIAALAMLGRIIGTALEKQIDLGDKTLLSMLTIVVGATVFIDFNIPLGIGLLLASTVVAQMLSYRLVYNLSSQAPQTHIASLLSGLGLIGRLFTAGIVFITGIFTSLNYFHLSFLAVAAGLALIGAPLLARISRNT
mgnify:CR=1 FL=1